MRKLRSQSKRIKRNLRSQKLIRLKKLKNQPPRPKKKLNLKKNLKTKNPRINQKFIRRNTIITKPKNSRTLNKTKLAKNWIKKMQI